MILALNDENGPGAVNTRANSADLIHSRQGTETIDEHANTPRRHSRRPGPAVTDMDALTIALDCAFEAAKAIQLGDKDHARGWLDDAREPAAKAFPLGDPASMGLALVLGKLREKAAA